MSSNAMAAFACGMNHPWTPIWAPVPFDSPVIRETFEKAADARAKCGHCFCIEAEDSHASCGKHLRCCKCGDLMAEKFVKAWLEIFAQQTPK